MQCFRLVVYVPALLSLTFMSVVEIVVLLLLLWSPCKLDFVSKFLLHVSGVLLSVLISVSGLCVRLFHVSDQWCSVLSAVVFSLHGGIWVLQVPFLHDSIFWVLFSARSFTSHLFAGLVL